MSDYSAETIFTDGDMEYKVSLSVGISLRDGKKDFIWNIITWERKRKSSRTAWNLTSENYPENMEFILTRLKTSIMMNIEKSFDRDMREFKLDVFRK